MKRPAIAATTGVPPPVPTEGQTKRRDANDVRVGGTKKNEDEDEDAMDVEPTPGQHPVEETRRYAEEHPIDQPAPTVGRGTEDVH